MTSREVLSRLRGLDVATTLRTLQRYEAAGLTPPPRRGWGSGGFGRTTDYPASTPAEFYAAYCLIHQYTWRVKFEDVPNIRNMALRIETGTWSRDELRDFIMGNEESLAAIWYWLANKTRAEQNINRARRFGLTYRLMPAGFLQKVVTEPNALGSVRYDFVAV